jgi:hypothetical protein
MKMDLREIGCEGLNWLRMESDDRLLWYMVKDI